MNFQPGKKSAQEKNHCRRNKYERIPIEAPIPQQRVGERGPQRQQQDIASKSQQAGNRLKSPADLSALHSPAARFHAQRKNGKPGNGNHHPLSVKADVHQQRTRQHPIDAAASLQRPVKKGGYAVKGIQGQHIPVKRRSGPDPKGGSCQISQNDPEPVLGGNSGQLQRQPDDQYGAESRKNALQTPPVKGNGVRIVRQRPVQAKPGNEQENIYAAKTVRAYIIEGLPQQWEERKGQSAVIYDYPEYGRAHNGASIPADFLCHAPRSLPVPPPPHIPRWFPL